MLRLWSGIPIPITPAACLSWIWSVSDEELVGLTIRPRSGDHTGAKLNPDFPDPARACAAAYGDFLFGGTTFRRVMAGLSSCRGGWAVVCRTLGCPDMALDQAYLRFHAAEGDRTPVTLLGLFPENIMRNVNREQSRLLGYVLGVPGA